MRPHDPMVSVDWLNSNIANPDTVVVDATWCMPGEDEPLPGIFIDGTRFDIDKIADPASGFAHTLPSPVMFEKKVRALGINKGTRVVCYDRHGIRGAARAWWMFRAMGHENVNVLDGGLPAWIKDGLPTVNCYHTKKRGNFTAEFQPELFKRSADVRAGLNNQQILDARPTGRFDGTTPEPRAGLSSGHMPGATNVPFSELIAVFGFLKSSTDLEKIFLSRQVDLEAPIITTCGSGITACGIALALARLGVWDSAVYDGSWTEWASIDDCPIEKVS